MRTLEDIQRDYNITCAQLGNMVYMRQLADEQAQKDNYEIDKLKNKLKSLNNEAKKLQGEVNGNQEQTAQPKSVSGVSTESN